MKKQLKVGDKVIVTIGSVKSRKAHISHIDPFDEDNPYQVQFDDGVSGWFSNDEVNLYRSIDREKLIRSLLVLAAFIALVLLISYVYRFAYEKGQQNGLNQGYKLRQVEEAFEKMNQTQNKTKNVYPQR